MPAAVLQASEILQTVQKLDRGKSRQKMILAGHPFFAFVRAGSAKWATLKNEIPPHQIHYECSDGLQDFSDSLRPHFSH